MAKRFRFGEIHLDVGAGREPSHGVPDSSQPFHIVIMGDFSGRASRRTVESGATLSQARPILIDRDNFDQVLGRLGVELRLPLGEVPLSLQFKELDDFHPDKLYEQVSLFRKLRESREKLANPATFAKAAEEMGALQPSEPSPQAVPDAGEEREPEAYRLVSGSLLDELVSATEQQPTGSEARRVPDEWTAYLRRLTAPHLVPRADPRQDELIHAIDEATSAQMRALLHLPDFQSLEAAWRALFFLVRRIETDSQLKLYLLDITKAEVAADLASSEDLQTTYLYKLLVEQAARTPGAEPWSLVVANYIFGPSIEDIELLGRLAKIGAAADAPFVSMASPALIGCSSINELTSPRKWKWPGGSEELEAWNAVRRLPEASFIGLILPRFLLRLPYGRETDAVELFGFQEMPARQNHEDYLWGNSAFLCALSVAEAFTDQGWSLQPGRHSQIDGLPLHIFQENGETLTQPCAEVLLTEDVVDRILETGVICVASWKGQDRVSLARLQSVAYPLRPLSGRWAG